MIYIHSLGRACRYYTQRTALVVDGAAVSFKALEERVRNIAAALAANGLAAGDRLALLLPNSPDYIELVGLRLQLARRYCSPDKRTVLRS